VSTTEIPDRYLLYCIALHCTVHK